jgi:hypothetical protein
MQGKKRKTGDDCPGFLLPWGENPVRTQHPVSCQKSLENLGEILKGNCVVKGGKL